MYQSLTDVSGGTTYTGEAELGRATTAAHWRLKKTVVAGSLTTVSYPVGANGSPSDSFEFAWDDRLALNFSLVDDTTVPTLSAVTIASDNDTTTLAKVGDEITVTIVASEFLRAPVITIAGNLATVASTSDKKNWTGKYVMAAGDTAGSVTFSVAFQDIAGRPGVTVDETSDASSVTFDKTVPTMLSAVRGSDTEITVTLSELALTASITKANAGGFTVVDAVTPATTYAVSAIAPGLDNTKVVLTVASVAGSDLTGIKVKYTAGGNGTVSDPSGNLLATNAAGITIPAWDSAPTLVSAERIANTTIRVKASEVLDTATTTKANAGGFVVTETGNPGVTYAVSAIAPNGGNHDEIDLTVADIVASAAIGVTVTYVKGGNGTVADDNGNTLETNATGVLVASWA
jgi:hypothetical protein